MYNDLMYLERALNGCKDIKVSLDSEYPLIFTLENNDEISFTIECYKRMIQAFQLNFFILRKD